MRLKTAVLVALLALPSAVARAGSAELPACHPQAWPLSRELTKKEVIAAARDIPREELIQMAVGELTNAQAERSMDIILLKFLHGTEEDRRLIGFFGGIAYMTYGEELKDLVKEWPQRGKRKAQLTPERVCDLYKKTLEMKTDE